MSFSHTRTALIGLLTGALCASVPATAETLKYGSGGYSSYVSKVSDRPTGSRAMVGGGTSAKAVVGGGSRAKASVSRGSRAKAAVSRGASAKAKFSSKRKRR